MSYKPSSKVHNTNIDYTVPSYVDVVVVEAADKTITLPDPVDSRERMITVISDNTNTTVNATNIEGDLAVYSNSTKTFISDTTDWHIL